MSKMVAPLILNFNKKLSCIIHEDLPVLKQVKKFVIQSGGKRIRPLIHHHFAKMLGVKSKEWLDVGAIGELIHAASLLHDDVVDESGLRRGEPTINALCGNRTAVLSGDYLLSCGLDHLQTLTHAQKLLPIFTRVIRMLAIGELLQMEWEKKLNMQDEVYQKIMLGKTASLFGAMTEGAAAVADQAETLRIRYRNFGEKMGVAFQIRDDFLDYYGDPESHGKSLFQDYERGLVTRPLILLLKESSRKDRSELIKIWKSPDRLERQGIDRFCEIAEHYSLRKKLAREIEILIHSLMKFAKEHPVSPERDQVVEQLAKLLVSPE